jgi:hypothetical protein
MDDGLTGRLLSAGICLAIALIIVLSWSGRPAMGLAPS